MPPYNMLYIIATIHSVSCVVKMTNAFFSEENLSLLLPYTFAIVESKHFSFIIFGGTKHEVSLSEYSMFQRIHAFNNPLLIKGRDLKKTVSYIFILPSLTKEDEE